MKIGVISDTHDYLDPKVIDLFEGVQRILHGGDIGGPWLVLQLENIAPVTAVMGNTDTGAYHKETELVQLAGKKILVHHIVDVVAPADLIRKKIIRENPDVVVFGHTHKPYAEKVGNTLYFNPGYAGKPRFGMSRSVAILTCEGNGISYEFLEL